MDAIENMLRTISFFLDNIIFNLISSAYELIAYLANVNIFQHAAIQDIVGRVYLLLGVFMLFKVSFSIIQYIIDPNSFTESGKGFGKLTTNVLVSLVLLISVPTIFNIAFELQNKLINSNAIPELIMGSNTGSTINVEEGENSFAVQASNMARDVQYIVFGTFYRLNTSSEGGIVACAPDKDHPSRDMFGSRDMAGSKECLDELKIQMDKEGPVTARSIDLGDFFKQLKTEGKGNVIGTTNIDGTLYYVVDNRNFYAFDSMLWWKIDGGPSYAINYTPIISTIAGGYILLLLFTFCADIAVRAIKLCFLQMVAPIAIISYIDPKESASQGKLNNWAKECLKTFFSLFLRLSIIFIALKLVQLVADLALTTAGNMGNGEGISSLFGQGMNGEQIVSPASMSPWIIFMLIVGIFTFAKQVPKMIEGIFGIKMSGELKLNPLKAESGAGRALSTGLGLLASRSIAGRVLKETGSKKAAAAALLSGAQAGYQNHGKNGIWGTAKNTAYKDVTGNDFARVGPADMLLRPGNKNKNIDSISDSIKKGGAQQRALAQQLATATHSTASTYDRMQAAGVDANSDLTAQKEHYGQIIDSHGNRSDILANIQDANKNVSRMEQILNGNFAPNKGTAEYSKLQSDIAAENSKISSLNESLGEIDAASTAINSIDAYETAVENEIGIRDTLDTLERKIGTLKDQKSQLKKIHRIDESPRSDVKEAIDFINKNK